MSESPKTQIRLTKKEFSVSYFCGSGAGGQARNKVASGVQIRHDESGAIGRACDTRSQHQNKIAAFQRLMKDPKMKFWIAKKAFEIRMGQTVEKQVEEDMKAANLQFEIKDALGRWEEVPESYFDQPAAREEFNP